MDNQRVRLSKKMLSEALLTLMKTTPINEISVTALCREAGINRTTFYKYYPTPEDILKEMTADSAAYWEQMLQKKHSPHQRLTMALDRAVSHLDRSGALIQENIKALYENPDRKNDSDIFYQLLAGKVDDNMRLYARFLTSVAMECWLKDSDRMDSEQFADFLMDLSALCNRYSSQKEEKIAARQT